MGYISLEDEITRRLPSILIDTESEFYHLCTYATLTITSGHPEKPSEDDGREETFELDEPLIGF